ncbi:hypothetical protein C6W19_15795 [Bacillus sp. RJGP41]|nr:hypothetical protein C6W19_15795 [Bacillus sp. RJGP41]
MFYINPNHEKSLHIDKKKSIYILKTKLIETKGSRLLRGKRVQGRPHRRKGAEESPGPPAESECLEWKSMFEF